MLRERTVSLALSALLSSVSLACEEEALSPVGKFMPTSCEGQPDCDDGRVKLDAGGGGPVEPGDTGLTDPVETDAGVLPDSGPMAMDAGESDVGVPLPPDSGVVNPPPSDFLNLAGTWRTRYVFDLSSYLFGISGIAGELDTLNQILQGNINTGFPPLDILIRNIVQQYVPMWVVDLVNVLNTIANLFSEVYANGGRMNIAQDLPVNPTDLSTLLHANETWTELVILLIQQCPLGRNDPNYPTCAERHIPVTMNPQSVGPLEIRVDIRPFDGVLSAGVPQADFRFVNREVGMEMRKLILLVLDIVTSLATPYPDFRTALGAAVDCQGLGQRAYDFAFNTLGLGVVVATTVEVTVRNQCNDVLDGLVMGIGNIGIDWEAFNFDQLGHAVDSNGDRRPEVLQNINVPDTLDGRFRFAIQSDMGGRWEGLP